jgi:hypothetical protein
MWHVDAPIAHHFANRIGAPTIANLIAFANATLFSLALSTLEKALVRNYLTNFPGLTLNNLRRHPPTSIPMTKGHMDQTRKNQRSTKTPTPPATIVPDADDPCTIEQEDTYFFPSDFTAKTHQCFTTIMEPTGQIYTDQTG